jgi:hypothetical protein
MRVEADRTLPNLVAHHQCTREWKHQQRISSAREVAKELTACLLVTRQVTNPAPSSKDARKRQQGMGNIMHDSLDGVV